MSTVVVQTHPLVDSYSGALLERVQAGLGRAGESHQVFRLGEGERAGPGDLAGASRLVLVYPTWWSGQPAMLLDWLQEMLAARAFESVDRLQVVTSLGSSRLVNTIQGEWGRRFLAERVLEACARGASFGWHALYKIDRRTTEEIATFLCSTEELLANGLSPAS